MIFQLQWPLFPIFLMYRLGCPWTQYAFAFFELISTLSKKNHLSIHTPQIDPLPACKECLIKVIVTDACWVL
jgi:hypothetical protein